jgi:hypothetical protein
MEIDWIYQNDSFSKYIVVNGIFHLGGNAVRNSVMNGRIIIKRSYFSHLYYLKDLHGEK